MIAIGHLIGGVNEVDRVRPSQGGENGRPVAAVLAVEDEAVLRVLMELSLGRAGYPFYIAASGEEALRLWAEHRAEIGVLVTDVAMPGPVDGIELIKRLRADCLTLRIILTTGSPGVRIPLGRNGGERPEILVKPYESAALVAAVQRAMAAPNP